MVNFIDFIIVSICMTRMCDETDLLDTSYIVLCKVLC